MKRWEQGRAVIDAMLQNGQLQEVEPNQAWAYELLKLAEEQLGAAEIILEASPLTSFQTSYDAMHKIFDAVLANQGLRATTRGGHLALEQALRAQLVPPLRSILDDFSWMRRLRHAGDYPVPGYPVADAGDALEGLDIVNNFLPKAKELVNVMPIYMKRTY